MKHQLRLIWRVLMAGALLVSVSGWVQAQRALIGYTLHNDFLSWNLKGTDRYYTAGNRFYYTQRSARKLRNSWSAGLQQQIFTANDISLKPDELTPQDYPYCGVTSLSFARSRISADSGRLWTAALAAGLTGSASGAREMQFLMHHIIEYKLPNGWDAQTEPGILLQFQAGLEQALVQRQWIQMSGSIRADVGTIFNQLSVGGDIIVGKQTTAFTTAAPILAPFSLQKKIGIFGVIRPGISVVAYNRLLEGPGLFSSRHNEKDMTRILWTNTAGLSLQSGLFRISLLQHWNTREFSSADAHAFGEISILVLLK